MKITWAFVEAKQDCVFVENQW